MEEVPARPFDITVDSSAKLVVSTFAGIVMLAHIIGGRDALAAEPGWDESFTHILDLSGVTSLALSVDDVKELVALPPMFAKVAMQIIVVAAGHDFGVARMFQLYAEQDRPNVHVVSSMARARELFRKNG